VVSRAAREAVPDAARLIFDAYAAAKRSALDRALGRTFLPWGEARWGEMLELFGGDPYPYGLDPANQAVVAALGGLLAEQGLVSPRPRIDDLFVPESHDFEPC
jgi:4,5-dihydroxyphthalate decarboxylase